MKTKLILLFLVAAFSFAACTDKNDDTTSLDSWVGHWRITGDPQPINTKASSGEITISPSKENTIIINAYLFGRDATIGIEGSVAGNVATFDYSDSKGRIYGDGTMRDINNIDFHYFTNDGADLFEYRVTAIRR